MIVDDAATGGADASVGEFTAPDADVCDAGGREGGSGGGVARGSGGALLAAVAVDRVRSDAFFAAVGDGVGVTREDDLAAVDSGRPFLRVPADVEPAFRESAGVAACEVNTVGGAAGGNGGGTRSAGRATTSRLTDCVAAASPDVVPLLPREPSCRIHHAVASNPTDTAASIRAIPRACSRCD